MSDLERFNTSHIPVTESGCWLWLKSTDAKGYGIFTIKQKNVRAHRFSYQVYKGAIPEGLAVCHACDVPSCVNPDHLWVGTALDNNRDIHKKGRFVHWQKLKTHCKRGHLLDERNVIPRNNGQRECRTCQKECHDKWVKIRVEQRRLKRIAKHQQELA